MEQGRVRRVVTGHDKFGKAIVIEDGFAPTVRTDENRPGYAMTQLWMTDGMPANIRNDPDPTDRPITLMPSRHGTVVRTVDFPPASLELRDIDPDAAKQAFAMFGQTEVLTTKGETAPRHPFMHRTETVDYGIVLSGEIVLLLDDSEVTLKAGDIAIQRGTNHAWTNRSEETCRMLFVLVDGTFDPDIAAAISTFDANA